MLRHFLVLAACVAVVSVSCEFSPARAHDEKKSKVVPPIADEQFSDVAWQPLFNGENLDGWTQKGGDAKYAIDGDMIVGTTVPKTPNSFLTTDKHYSDFVLELEFKVDPELNSGVQIRSNVYDEDREVEVKASNGETKTRKVNAGRVHGYQVEIDAKERAWSGGIYDEGRRGWLNDLSRNDAARAAFRQNEWNHFRIVAVGDHIQTWINGVPAADLKDDMTPSGFIALQVHGVGNREDQLTVAWRNIRIKDLGEAKKSSASGAPQDAPIDQPE